MEHDDRDERLPVGDVPPLTRWSVLQRAGWAVAAAAALPIGEGGGGGGAAARPGAAQSAAITMIPGVVFSGSNDGAIRAYSTRDGSIIWTYDTNRDFETLNHVPAKGASLIGPGPTVAGGMLYVNSGYGAYGGVPATCSSRSESSDGQRGPRALRRQRFRPPVAVPLRPSMV